MGAGNAANTRAYLAHLATVRTSLHLDQLLVTGDSKLITQGNCLGFCRVGARFVGPTSLTQADRAVFAPKYVYDAACCTDHVIG